ncbi:hypothetical protein V1511DRAFT_486986 [Dipodascopsis uninucleata]
MLRHAALVAILLTSFLPLLLLFALAAAYLRATRCRVASDALDHSAKNESTLRFFVLRAEHTICMQRLLRYESYMARYIQGSAKDLEFLTCSSWISGITRASKLRDSGRIARQPGFYIPAVRRIGSSIQTQLRDNDTR